MEPSELGKSILSSINWIKDIRQCLYLDKGLFSICCDDISKNIHHFRYDNTIVRRKNKIVISYNCVKCKRENILSLNNIISKIDRNKSTCNSCQSILLQDYSFGDNNSSLLGKMKNDERDFLNMDQTFQDNYHRKIMSAVQFNLLRKNMKTFQNEKYIISDDITYFPYFRNNPSMKCFEPMFYDKIRDTIEKPLNIKFECNHCGYTFVNKNLNNYRNKPYILCKKCEIDFGPTKQKNIDVMGTNVSYKTKFQNKFLKNCNKNELKCVNGPIFEFAYNDDLKKSHIDYFLPNLNIYIDVVGNKEFQNDDKPYARRNAVQILIYQCKGQYFQVYPKNYLKVLKYICKLK